MTAEPRLRIADGPDAGPAEPDGRRRRSQDSRARIVRAMLELVQSGEVAPAAEQVAARARVGLRSVFRHFKDMDSLYGEMSAVIEAELRAVVEQPLKGKTPRDRLAEIVQRRAAVYERIAPFKRASDVHRHGSRFLENAQAALVAASRDILETVLPPAVARDRLRFEALDLLLSFEAWNRLRRDQGLPQKRTVEVLEAAAGRLLG